MVMFKRKQKPDLVANLRARVEELEDIVEGLEIQIENLSTVDIEMAPQESSLLSGHSVYGLRRQVEVRDAIDMIVSHLGLYLLPKQTTGMRLIDMEEIIAREKAERKRAEKINGKG